LGKEALELEAFGNLLDRLGYEFQQDEPSADPASLQSRSSSLLGRIGLFKSELSSSSSWLTGLDFIETLESDGLCCPIKKPSGNRGLSWRIAQALARLFGLAKLARR
jgi:hypothetical protein